jgi:hypothetical protein
MLVSVTINLQRKNEQLDSYTDYPVEPKLSHDLIILSIDQIDLELDRLIG